MRKIFKSSLAVVITVIMLFASVVTSFADTTEVNSGSTLEYTLSIADSEQNIAGIHFELYFDTEVLKIKEINTDNLSGSVINDNMNGDGRITVVNGLINGSRGLECKEKTDLIKVTFDVISDGNTEVQYYIPYMYDYNLTNLYKYTLSEKVVIDGETAKDNEPPVLADVDKLMGIEGFDRGDFVNNKEGKADGTAPAGHTQPVTIPQVGEYKTLQYTFSIANATQALSNLKISFFFDNSIMQIDKVTSEVFASPTVNYDHHNKGVVVVNGAFDKDAPVYKDKTDLLTLTFKVFGEGDTTVKYYVNQMEDTSDVMFYNYTFTDKTVLDGEVLSEGKAPVLAGEEELARVADFDKGDFVNSASGIGSGVKPENKSKGEEDSKNNTVLIAGVCAVLVIIAIVVLVVIKSKSSDGDSEDNETE
ncbi:MAG: hypothetical protein IKJ83_03175 [Ruminococcus sp.]|nr:hypothetical protein [Ruminococcus sp.]